jgi:hypothetical protein
MSNTSGHPDFKTLVAIDVVSSVASACLVAPFVTMIDQGAPPGTPSCHTFMSPYLRAVG